MRFFLLGLAATLVSMALGHPAAEDQTGSAPAAPKAIVINNPTESTNLKALPDLRQYSTSSGMWGCIQTYWLGGCAYFPVKDECQNVRIQNLNGGWEGELRTLGPDCGTKCYVYAGTDCTHPFYPKHDTPPIDWSFSCHAVLESPDVVRSFRCQ